MPAVQTWLESVTHGLDFSGGPGNADYGKNLQIFQRRMYGQLSASGLADQANQALGVPAPGMHEMTITLDDGSQQRVLVPYGGINQAVPQGQAQPSPGITTGAGVGAGAGISTGAVSDGSVGGAGGIPGAPPGTIAVGSPTFTKTQRDQWDALAQKQKDLSALNDFGADQMQRIDKARQLLARFQPGATAPVRQEMGALAADLGFKDPDAIAKGDVAAMEEFGKYMADQMRSASQDLKGGVRNLAEYRDIQAATPSIKMRPEAIEHMFDSLQQTFLRGRLQQRFITDFIRNNQGNRNAAGVYDEGWRRIEQMKGLLDPNLTSPSRYGPDGLPMKIPPGDLLKLLGDDSPESQAAIDHVYGQGTSQKFLNPMWRPTASSPEHPARLQPAPIEQPTRQGAVPAGPAERPVTGAATRGARGTPERATPAGAADRGVPGTQEWERLGEPERDMRGAAGRAVPIPGSREAAPGVAERALRYGGPLGLPSLEDVGRAGERAASSIYHYGGLLGLPSAADIGRATRSLVRHGGALGMPSAEDVYRYGEVPGAPTLEELRRRNAVRTR